MVDQTDLLADRKATMREIFAFLSVDDTFVSPRLNDEMNTSKELRSYSSYVVLRRRLFSSMPLLHRLPRGVRRGLRQSAQRIMSAPLDAETLDDDLRDRLYGLYADDVRRLRELTGKTFPTWAV